MKIFLLGLPGSGKTTLGKQLALRLGYDFLDTDELIVKNTGRTIEDIFSRDGEPAFRILEKNTLHTLGEVYNCIISTGGGLPCFHDNMEEINRQGVSVYLKVSVDALMKRLTAAGNEHRPLVKGKTPEEVKQFLLERLKDREPYYLQAKIVLEGDELTAEEIEKKVVRIG